MNFDMAEPGQDTIDENCGFLESIQDILAHAESNIEAEVLRSKQHWLACFESVLTEVIAYLEMAHDAGEISDVRFDEANARLEDVTIKVEELRKQYEKEGAPVPENIQRGLIASLSLDAGRPEDLAPDGTNEIR